MSTEGTGRVLQLLALLSSRRGWTGTELAERLEITDRTLRRDVDRLRQLGYQVDGTRGAAGGYELRAGTDLPPLFLEDDEAIAIVAALLVVAAQRSTGMDDSTTRALAKLHHVMPSELIGRLAALETSTRAVPRPGGPVTTEVDPAAVALIAEATRDRVRVTFTYRTRDGATGERRVEPHHVVTPGRVWYLVGWDLDRDDWRTFRIDRMADITALGHRFDPRPLPVDDPGDFLAQAIARTPMAFHASIQVPMARARLCAAHPGVLPERVTSTGRRSCRVDLAADDVDALVVQIVELLQVAAGCTVDAPQEVQRRLRTLTDSLRGALDPAAG